MHIPHSNREIPVFVQGSAGSLEALISGIGDSNRKHVGIICHPHPLYQGSMDNKVVTTIARIWQHLEFSTVRFNFRGVGKSEGNYGNGVGEVEDLGAVFKWAQQNAPGAHVWLAGFSFGAFIATQFAAENSINGLITIAPALSLFDFVKLKMPNCPWLIIHGEQDELVPIEKIKEWYHSLMTRKAEGMPLELVTLTNATHFFHGYLNDLKGAIEEFIRRLDINKLLKYS